MPNKSNNQFKYQVVVWILHNKEQCIQYKQTTGNSKRKPKYGLVIKNKDILSSFQNWGHKFPLYYGRVLEHLSKCEPKTEKHQLHKRQKSMQE